MRRTVRFLNYLTMRLKHGYRCTPAWLKTNETHSFGNRNLSGPGHHEVFFSAREPFEFQSADQLQRSWDAGAGNAFEMPEAYPAMDKATRRLLADFFEPYNQQLYHLIDENYGWY